MLTSKFPINQDSWPYIRIALLSIVYQFKPFFFCLSTAPHLFTRVSWQARDTYCPVSAIANAVPHLLEHRELLNLQRPGDNHQLGEIKPQANQQCLLSQDADRHQLREGLSDGFPDCQILWSDGWLPLSPVSPCKDVAANPKPHGFARMVCFKGQGQGAAPSVTTEVTLVFSHEQPRDASPLVGVPAVCQVLVTGGEPASGVPLHLPPLSFLSREGMEVFIYIYIYSVDLVAKIQNPFLCESCFEEFTVLSLANFVNRDRWGIALPCQSYQEIPQQDGAVQAWMLWFICLNY